MMKDTRASTHGDDKDSPLPPPQLSTRCRIWAITIAGFSVMCMFISYIMFSCLLIELQLEQLCSKSSANATALLACEQSPEATKAASLRMGALCAVAGVCGMLSVNVVNAIGMASCRRVALLLSSLGFATICLAFALVPGRLFWKVLIPIAVVCFLTGGPFSFVQSATAVVIDVTANMRPSTQVTILSLINGGLLLGTAIGPVVGGEIAKRLGLQYAYFCSAAMGGCAALCSLLLPNTSARTPLSWARVNPLGAFALLLPCNGFGGSRAPVRSRLKAALLMVVLCLLIFSGTGSLTIIPFFGKIAWAWGSREVGIAQSLYFAACFAGLVIGVPLVQCIACGRTKAVLVLSALWCCFTWASACFVTKTWHLYLAMGCMFFNNGFLPYLSNALPALFPDAPSRALALLGAVQTAAIAASSPISLALWSELDARWTADHVHDDTPGRVVGLTWAVGAAGSLIAALLSLCFAPSFGGGKDKVGDAEGLDEEAELNGGSKSAPLMPFAAIDEEGDDVLWPTSYR